jgi:hypothetical protein
MTNTFWKLFTLLTVAVAILLLAASPGFVSAASPAMEKNCDMQQMPNHPAIPLCCLTQENGLASCGLIGQVSGSIIPSDKLPEVKWSDSVISSSVQILQKQNVSFWFQQLSVIRKIPPLSGSPLYCRNSLNSEEPACI